MKNTITTLIVTTITLTFLISTISTVTAGDVAYIYKNPSAIDDNIVSVFKELGLTVDLINEKMVLEHHKMHEKMNESEHHHEHKLIFIGDEVFRHKDMLAFPIAMMPTIIINSRHADLWGITDNEGVSKLSSNMPLKVNKNSNAVQVYTQSADNKGKALRYYYIDDRNKVCNPTKSAGVYTGSVGYDFGNVVSYFNEGTNLSNGMKSKARICFFGLTSTDYWTAEAKKMFKDCINFVLQSKMPMPPGNGTPIPPQNETQPPQNITEPPQNETLPGNETGEDEEDDTEEPPVTNETRQLIHDISLIDFKNSVNKIRIQDMNKSDILENDTIKCNEDYKVIIKVKNNGNETENVTFQGEIGGIMFNHLPTKNLAPGDSSTKTRTINISLSEGIHTIKIEAILPSDENIIDNKAERQALVICPPAY